jgi:hypothetical protein
VLQMVGLSVAWRPVGCSAYQVHENWSSDSEMERVYTQTDRQAALTELEPNPFP